MNTTKKQQDLEKEAEHKIDRGIDYANPSTVWEGIAQLNSLLKKKYFDKGKALAISEFKEKLLENAKIHDDLDGGNPDCNQSFSVIIDKTAQEMK